MRRDRTIAAAAGGDAGGDAGENGLTGRRKTVSYNR